MGIAERYYSKVNENDLLECKKINEYWRICKQLYPVLSTHLHEECEAQMLQSIRKIPSDCSVRIVELNQTLWTPLDNNEWLYVAALQETITVLCENQDPVDVRIEGTGKLQFVKKCKGYGPKVLIASKIIISSNTSHKDVIPPLSLSYDCCVDDRVTEGVSKLKINSHLKHIVNNIEDLKYASHKVQEVENLLSEEEWKQSHSERVYNLSFMSIIGLIVILMILCCYCCKCYKVCFPYVWKPCTDTKSCPTIVFRPKIINKVHTSNDSISRNHEQEEVVRFTSLDSSENSGGEAITSLSVAVPKR